MDLALAIHVLRKSRWPLLVNLGIMVVTTIGFFIWSPIREETEGTVGMFGFYPMVASLYVTLFAFHFTEGTRRAGFGSYPKRLFVLPVSTFRLAAIPMLVGVVVVVAVYAVWAQWILPLVHIRLKLFWPCMFAAAACLGFQALVWALARFRTAKLFGLGVFGTLLMCSWVMLMEEMATALVLAISPSLTVEQAVPLYLGSISVACFVTGYITVYHQRHRSFGVRKSGLGWVGKRLATRLERTRRFESPESALLWHEWRLMGRVFPMCVALVCGLLLLLSCGIGTVTPTATVNVMIVLAFTPITLAAILGSEYGKPDFWSKGLVPLLYLLTQPISNAAYVVARVKVAGISAALAWVITAVSLSMWVSVFADNTVTQWLRNVVGMSYNSFGWLSLVGFLLLLGWVATMRLLCGNIWLTMLGSSKFYSIAGTTRGVLGFGLMIVAIFVPDWKGDRAWLTTAAHIGSFGLCVLGVVHGGLMAMMWSRVIATEATARRQFAETWKLTAIFAGLVGVLGYQAISEVDWLRVMSWQLALYCFPVLAAALGIGARMKVKAARVPVAWRRGPVVLGVVWMGVSIWLGINAMKVLPILADAGGHSVRMMIRGRGKPVVVFEQFGPGPLEPWAKIQNGVAEFATAVIYEHAGGMASGAGLPPRDGKRISRELRDALRSADLEPPFVMVGYSMAGPYVRVFAGEYPDEVAGLVLIDPSKEKFFEWLWENDPESHKIANWHLQAKTELGMTKETFKQAAAAGIPHVPTVVLTGGKGKNTVKGRLSMPRWIAAHRDYVARLPKGRHVISKRSGHAIPFQEPERVVEVIRQLVHEVRERP